MQQLQYVFVVVIVVICAANQFARRLHMNSQCFIWLMLSWTWTLHIVTCTGTMTLLPFTECTFTLGALWLVDIFASVLFVLPTGNPTHSPDKCIFLHDFKCTCDIFIISIHIQISCIRCISQIKHLLVAFPAFSMKTFSFSRYTNIDVKDVIE